MIRVGCSGLPREDREKFFQNCRILELRAGFVAPPGLSVLKKWKAGYDENAPELDIVWTAWNIFTYGVDMSHKDSAFKLLDGEQYASFGYFRDTPENDRVWKQIVEQAQAVGARRILMQTPSSFTPSAVNKDNFVDFLARRAQLPDTMSLVWHAAGFWQREECLELVSPFGVEIAVDPLVDENEDLPDTSRVYFQMLGRHGLMDSYSDDDLCALADICSGFEHADVVFRTYNPVRDALRLLALSAEG